MPFFAFTGEGNKGESFTRKLLMHRFLRPCGEEVKAKNEKRRTRAHYARVLGVEVGAEVGGGGIHDREGRPNSGERGLSVAAASLQM